MNQSQKPSLDFVLDPSPVQLSPYRIEESSLDFIQDSSRQELPTLDLVQIIPSQAQAPTLGEHSALTQL